MYEKVYHQLTSSLSVVECADRTRHVEIHMKRNSENHVYDIVSFVAMSYRDLLEEIRTGLIVISECPIMD